MKTELSDHSDLIIRKKTPEQLSLSDSFVNLLWLNTQVSSSDVITSLCGYSSVNEAWKVFVYVNGGASAIGDA